jgi:hypothetical protein
MDYVGSGKKGTDVRKQFGGRKYGWPQDAIDAALIVLLQADGVQARAGSEPVLKGKLDQKNIAAAEFRVETEPISKVQLIELRGLFKKAGLTTQPGQESTHASNFLERLTRLSQEAGGPPPLSKHADHGHLAEIANRVGNDQLRAIHDAKDRLAQEIAEWEKKRELIAQRQPRWVQLTALLGHAADLPVVTEVRPEVEAIERNRSLLAEPDPVPGLVEKLTSALRRALNESHAACQCGYDAGQANLDGSANWQKLTPEQKYELRSKQGAREVRAIAVGTTEEILDTLHHIKLSELKAVCDALPTRFGNMLEAAAKLLEPKAQPVSLASVTIKTEDDLIAWLADSERRIRQKLKDGPVIL